MKWLYGAGALCAVAVLVVVVTSQGFAQMVMQRGVTIPAKPPVAAPQPAPAQQSAAPAQGVEAEVDVSQYIVKQNDNTLQAIMSDLTLLSCNGEKVTARHFGTVSTYQELPQCCVAAIAPSTTKAGCSTLSDYDINGPTITVQNNIYPGPFFVFIPTTTPQGQRFCDLLAGHMTHRFRDNVESCVGVTGNVCDASKLESLQGGSVVWKGAPVVGNIQEVYIVRHIVN